MMLAQSALWVGSALRRCGADRGRGLAARCRLGGRGRRPCRRAASGAGRAMAGRHAARHRRRRGGHRQGRIACPRVACDARARTNASTLTRCKRSPPARRPRRNIGCNATMAPGGATSDRSSRKRRSDAGLPPDAARSSPMWQALCPGDASPLNIPFICLADPANPP